MQSWWRWPPVHAEVSVTNTCRCLLEGRHPNCNQDTPGVCCGYIYAHTEFPLSENSDPRRTVSDKDRAGHGHHMESRPPYGVGRLQLDSVDSTLHWTWIICGWLRQELMCNFIISFLNYNPGNASKNTGKIGSFFTGIFSPQCPLVLWGTSARAMQKLQVKNRWGAKSPFISYGLLSKICMKLSILHILNYISPYAE